MANRSSSTVGDLYPQIHSPSESSRVFPFENLRRWLGRIWFLYLLNCIVLLSYPDRSLSNICSVNSCSFFITPKSQFPINLKKACRISHRLLLKDLTYVYLHHNHMQRYCLLVFLRYIQFRDSKFRQLYPLLLLHYHMMYF